VAARNDTRRAVLFREIGHRPQGALLGHRARIAERIKESVAVQRLGAFARHQVHDAGIGHVITRAPGQQNVIGRAQHQRMQHHLARRRRAHEKIVEAFGPAAQELGLAGPGRGEMGRQFFPQPFEIVLGQHVLDDGVAEFVDRPADILAAGLAGVETGEFRHGSLFLVRSFFARSRTRAPEPIIRP